MVKRLNSWMYIPTYILPYCHLNWTFVVVSAATMIDNVASYYLVCKVKMEENHD